MFKGTMSSVLDKELDPESVEIVQNVLHPSSSSEVRDHKF